MGSFLARRLAATLPVLLVVAVLVFLMLRLTPGDPAAVLAGDAASTEQIARIRAGLGLDRSLPEQFAIWVGRMLSGVLPLKLRRNIARASAVCAGSSRACSDNASRNLSSVLPAS